MIPSLTSVNKKIFLLFLIIIGLYFTKIFLMPLCIAVILASLFLPLCNGLERKIPRAIAVSLCLLLLLLIFISFAALLSWQILELSSDLDLVKSKLVETGTLIQNFIFNHFGITAVKQIQLIDKEHPSYSNIIQMMASSILYILSNLLLILVYFFFLLFYRIHLKNYLILLTPLPKQNEMKQMLISSAHISQQYLLGLSKMIVCLWIMYGIGFGLIGVENFLFFAIICGVLEIVPFVGNLTGTILTVAVAALHDANTVLLLGILITYGLVQFIQGWFLEPLILGPQVKINPFFTIIALILGQLIWGIPGIILAIPVTAIFKIVCDHSESLKPYGFLIGEIKKV